MLLFKNNHLIVVTHATINKTSNYICKKWQFWNVCSGFYEKNK